MSEHSRRTKIERSERTEVDFTLLTGCCFTDWPTVRVEQEVKVRRKLLLLIPVWQITVIAPIRHFETHSIRTASWTPATPTRHLRRRPQTRHRPQATVGSRTCTLPSSIPKYARSAMPTNSPVSTTPEDAQT